ncbi:MAG: fluoride efflux transporter CrcB [Bacteroidota bacterium]
MNIHHLLLVGAGGFVGSALRYQISLAFFHRIGNGFPVGTLIVNLVGSLLIGILLSGAVKSSQSWTLLLVSGFCGGFTTFSTFAIENIKLIENGNWNISIVYLITSLLGGLALCLLGYFGLQFILKE